MQSAHFQTVSTESWEASWIPIMHLSKTARPVHEAYEAEDIISLHNHLKRATRLNTWIGSKSFSWFSLNTLLLIEIVAESQTINRRKLTEEELSYVVQSVADKIWSWRCCRYCHFRFSCHIQGIRGILSLCTNKIDN